MFCPFKMHKKRLPAHLLSAAHNEATHLVELEEHEFRGDYVATFLLDRWQADAAASL